MTRRDYIMIAAALAEARPAMFTPEWNAWTDTTYSVAAALAKGNPRFDRERFLNATVS